MFKWVLPALAFALITPGPASADTTLNYIDQASGRGSVQITIHGNKTFITDLRGQRINALYNARSNALTLLDRKQKTYTVLGRNAPQRIQQFVQAVSGVQHSLAKIFTGASPSTKRLRIKPTGRTAQSGDHQCKVLDARMNGSLTAEICVAPAKALDIGSADAATLQALGRTVQRLVGSLTPYLTVGGATDFIAQGKVPFRVTHVERGKTYTDLLKTVSSKHLSSTRFTVPKGYSERSLTAEIFSLSQGSY